jgi:hypothetical protein
MPQATIYALVESVERSAKPFPRLRCIMKLLFFPSFRRALLGDGSLRKLTCAWPLACLPETFFLSSVVLPRIRPALN